MKRQATFILFLLLTVTALNAQLQVISAAGAVDETDNGSISWTLGETVVGTLEGSDGVITQGFQQSNLEVATGIEGPDDLDIQTTAYPNPVQNQLTVEVQNQENLTLHFQLFDLNGKLLQEGPVEASRFTLNLDAHPAGQYILQIRSDQELIKSFNIVKR
ncbi:MAG: T9SS type A sorting domain-containing protein [Marinilabiliaceae bacterium]